MACSERFALGAYLLGLLDPAEHSAVGRHVVRCADCRAELLELAPLVELLRRLPFVEPPQPGWGVQGPGPVEAVPRPAPVLEPGCTAGALSRVVRRAKIRRALVGCALVVAAAGVGVGIHLGAGARSLRRSARRSRSPPPTWPPM